MTVTMSLPPSDQPLPHLSLRNLSSLVAQETEATSHPLLQSMAGRMYCLDPSSLPRLETTPPVGRRQLFMAPTVLVNLLFSLSVSIRRGEKRVRQQILKDKSHLKVQRGLNRQLQQIASWGE